VATYNMVMLEDWQGREPGQDWRDELAAVGVELNLIDTTPHLEEDDADE
jgi:hypothetical protein